MARLIELFRKHIIVWKNFNSDMRSLLLIGLPFMPETKDKDDVFYDIELFYRKETPLCDNQGVEISQTSSTPISLKWLSKYVLFDDKSQAEGVQHNPVIDAANHLKLFMKLHKVMPFNGPEVKTVDKSATNAKKSKQID